MLSAGSTNSVGFGAIGRIVTSSIAVIGGAARRLAERRFSLRLLGRRRRDERLRDRAMR